MIDEQKLRELAEAATPGPWHWDGDPVKGDPLDRVRFRVVATGRTITQCYYSSSDGMAQKEAEWIASTNPSAILALLDELQTLREQKIQLQEFSKLACRALDDCSRVLTTIDVEDLYEQDQIDELNARVTNLAVQAMVLNGLTHGGQLDAEIDASLKEAVKQARIDALEEAKQAVDGEGFREPEGEYEAGYNKACDICVAAIESLKGKTP
ncbi:MAG TPA: hypothetical protein DCY64_22740 [Hydrogenophaga sp.]|uniref:ead/Ea22-like family protein n=1 Tax=Hydrogenophaga sp. TaxID=1904254 RepID=UPI0008AD785E|nr:ead/Ea22-like family protein [Hydrogenophaga sp.]OGA78804.1 MAG: hypothetical protein A2X73_07580 [Burkholderiales bacterium GWE1_65_30]OGA89375.1 MAG: hypothetical protein A2X72_16740 [Burkholderiales bacterium GWF1_66_17]HAX23090.1 hypothetical protein [Hydrogenophaga sp.]HBU17045.1 hypothetical protein [Hydrogenophaga sp.]